MKLNWNFPRGVKGGGGGGGGVLEKKSLPCGRYRYFLELHNIIINDFTVNFTHLHHNKMWHVCKVISGYFVV